MEKSNANSGNFKIIPIVYGTLIFGVLVFLIFVITTIPIANFEVADGSIFMYLVPVFLMLSVFLSNFLFQKEKGKLKTSNFLYAKLTRYQSANIMRGAPLEGSGLIAIVALYLTGNSYYLIFVGFSLLLMIFNFPSKNKFENFVTLTMEEKNKLKNI